MASVFLSYDHEDADRAAPIAAALEKAGHSVWWDRHIHGGAEYNSEIESAVERADIVVVLWSERSVRSAWVRDEAAEGRDRGRLVPVGLDGAKPPMGFRQYQTIDLSGWKGGARIPRLEQLLESIERVCGSPDGRADAARPAPVRHERLDRPRRHRIVAAAVAFIALVIVIAAVLAWRPWSAGGSATVAVAAADSSAVSREYASDLLAQLGQLQSAKPETLQLVGGDAGRRANLRFEVGGKHRSGQALANLVLTDGTTGGLLWSKAFERPADKVGDLRQEISYTAAQVIECVTDAHPDGRSVLKPETLKLYLSGCAELASANPEKSAELIPVFRQLIAAAPKFAGAWAKLIVAEDTAYVGLADSEAGERLLADLRRDIAAARKVDPDMAEAYLAESYLLPLNAFAQRFALVDRAIAAEPDRSQPLAARSDILFAIGRVSDALDDARRATALNPISPLARNNYIFALAQAGRTQAALDEIAKAERTWPGSSVIEGARFAFHLRFGDPRIAWKMIESGQTGAAWIGAKSFIDARIDPTPANVDQAIKDGLAAYAEDKYVIQHVVQTMSILNREKEMLDLLMRIPVEDAAFVTDVLFRPAAGEFWRNPESFRYAKRVGLLDYWQKSEQWPDFCRAGDLPYDCKEETARFLA